MIKSQKVSTLVTIITYTHKKKKKRYLSYEGIARVENVTYAFNSTQPWHYYIYYTTERRGVSGLTQNFLEPIIYYTKEQNTRQDMKQSWYQSTEHTAI